MPVLFKNGDRIVANDEFNGQYISLRADRNNEKLMIDIGNGQEMEVSGSSEAEELAREAMEVAGQAATDAGAALDQVGDLSDTVTELSGTVGNLSNDVDGIEELIPSQASSSNQLADKSFVNSTAATNTANFVGTYNSLTDLEAVQDPTNNDYGFVVSTDSSGNTVYNRYKYTTFTTPASWEYEYSLNNSSFTAAQWAAINSGATDSIINNIPVVDQVYSASSTNPPSSVALGNAKFLRNTATGSSSLTINGSATSSQNAVNVGPLSSVSGDGSTALGYRAMVTATRAHQIGNGTNSEANTLKVAIYDSTTSQYNNVTLLNSSGQVPKETVAYTRNNQGKLDVSELPITDQIQNGNDWAASSNGVFAHTLANKTYVLNASIATSSWVANSDSVTSGAYPYKATVTDYLSTDYQSDDRIYISASFTPADVVNGNFAPFVSFAGSLGSGSAGTTLATTFYAKEVPSGVTTVHYEVAFMAV